MTFADLFCKPKELSIPTVDLFPSVTTREFAERKIAAIEWRRKEREREIEEIKRKIKVCDDRGHHRWILSPRSSMCSSMSMISATSKEDLEMCRKRNFEEAKKREEEEEKNGPWECIDCQITKYKEGQLVPHILLNYSMTPSGYRGPR